MQWIFPEDNSIIVLGAVQADQVRACSLVPLDGEALGSGWTLSGEKILGPELFYSMIVSVKAKKT